jgi:type IV fimbrial biogenesis protein FimT
MGDESRADVLRRRAGHASGFTLVEVIVALAILAILLALAVPAMNRWISNVKVRAAADALQNGIRLAQSESLRRSRQVVFSLTNTTDRTTLQNSGLTAVQNGSYWSLNTIPSMTDGSETNQFIEAGVLTTTTSGVTITGPAAICFNSVGRVAINGSTGITGATCALPTGNPPVQSYQVALATSDRPLQVNVALGGQVHLCDPNKTLSATNPDGCP